MGVEYDGRLFCGWQSQPAGCGVQDVLETAVSRIAGHPVRVVAAGRTDTGVHALGQVAHFDVEFPRPEHAWVRGVNAFLPDGLAVQWARPVAADFHARFSARERCYRYWLLNHPVRPALLSGRVGWYHSPLDLARIQEATGLLVGTHDFSAFRAAECQAKSPVKALRRLEVRRQGDLILFELCADAFLHHMVRNIVGSLVYVGKGRFGPEWIAGLLQSGDRSQAAPTFSPAGLYLTQVGYESRWGLPDQWGRNPFFAA